MKGALAAGTVLSLVAASGWAYMAMLAIGPAEPVNLTWRHPLASYVALASAPTGNGWELFAVVAFIYFACLLVAGWRRPGGA